MKIPSNSTNIADSKNPKGVKISGNWRLWPLRRSAGLSGIGTGNQAFHVNEYYLEQRDRTRGFWGFGSFAGHQAPKLFFNELLRIKITPAGRIPKNRYRTSSFYKLAYFRFPLVSRRRIEELSVIGWNWESCNNGGNVIIKRSYNRDDTLVTYITKVMLSRNCK